MERNAGMIDLLRHHKGISRFAGGTSVVARHDDWDCLIYGGCALVLSLSKCVEALVKHTFYCLLTHSRYLQQLKMEYSVIDLDTWPRKQAYDYFKDYDDPFFNITTMLEVGAAFKGCKATKRSFFLSCLYASLKAANAHQAFKLRWLNGQVVAYQTIHGGSTILHDDHTFSFCYFDYTPDWAAFERAGKVNIEAQQQSKVLDPKLDSLNMIHYSVLPWTHFTSFKHARKFRQQDTIPKIVFGKAHDEGTKTLLPISVQVHHAMMDGYHLGIYLQDLQEIFDEMGQ